MSDKKYYVPERFLNEHFTAQEIQDWNNWLKQGNYKIFTRFERIARLKLAAGAKRLSARSILYDIREQTHWKMDNGVSPFIGFMYCCKYPDHAKYFKQKKKKHLLL